MQTQTIPTKISENLKQNPKSIKREIEILYELGLESYEVDYLIFLKTKREVSLKWQD